MLELVTKYDKLLQCWSLYVIDENDNILYRPTTKEIYFSRDLLKHALGIK